MSSDNNSNEIRYEILKKSEIKVLAPLVSELMQFQKSQAIINPERFDNMSFETRLLPSVADARENFFMVAKVRGSIIAYVYSNISHKMVYNDGQFGRFFDMDSVQGDYIGCLAQFYIKPRYRGLGIGSILFKKSMEWLKNFDYIKDIFIYVSNGNQNALKFYQHKGFSISHDILDGFITVLRNKTKS